MKRITFMISAVLFLCSVTFAFAADAVAKVLPKQLGEKSSITSNKSGKNKLKQNNPLRTKTKRKAWGDPHVERNPNVNKLNR